VARILLKTAIRPVDDDWNIGRFSLLASHLCALSALNDASGSAASATMRRESTLPELRSSDRSLERGAFGRGFQIIMTWRQARVRQQILHSHPGHEPVAIEVEDEQPDGRRQIGVLSPGVDLLDQIGQSHAETGCDFLERCPEGVLQTDARLVAGKRYGAFDNG
jgi:hypothetical protein